MKGKHHSPLSKWLQHLAHLGSKGHTAPHSAETRRKISERTRAAPNLLRGANHHAWKGGVTVLHHGERHTAEYKRWRWEVYMRDGFTCQECGDNRGGNLHAHHIKPWHDYPELRYDVSNGITLCQKCHRRKHGKRPDPKE